MKLLLLHQKEKIKIFSQEEQPIKSVFSDIEFSKIHRKNMTKLVFFQVAIHFHPSHPSCTHSYCSFCALVGLLLTKLDHYFNDSIGKKNVLLAIHSDPIYRCPFMTHKLSTSISIWHRQVWIHCCAASPITTVHNRACRPVFNSSNDC